MSPQSHITTIYTVLVWIVQYTVFKLGWDLGESGRDLAECRWDPAVCGRDLAEWLEHLTASAKSAPVLGSISVFFNILRHRGGIWGAGDEAVLNKVTYFKKIQKFPFNLIFKLYSYKIYLLTRQSLTECCISLLKPFMIEQIFWEWSAKMEK